MVATPAAIAETAPEAEPTVATPGLLLLQTPPGIEFINDVALPAQMDVVPEMDVGVALTVMIRSAAQPVGNV